MPPTAYPNCFAPGLADPRLVAVAGCYPTAATLGLAPLLRAGAISPEGIVVDAASGLSGAGRSPKPNTAFCAANEDVTAYGLAGSPGDQGSATDTPRKSSRF
ncbi:MAG: hypothetical protein CM1200mP26_27710 [Acidimicrobiales bacterium]|nr:MAG: hypothetical protein CM1200mP26_27710 [Acidimicrobiales bacterium]